jgi:hypothetical protein
MKGRHDPDRVATRNGTAPGSVALGGRMVPVDRLRATLTAGGELALDSYALFSSTDLLDALAVERMLAGVATRRHRDVAEPIGAGLEAVARGDSRSAISRRFKTATTKALDELLARDLGELDVAALMIDGIIFAEVCCVVALAITVDGTRVPVGLWDGDTENGTVVTDLLADLIALRYEAGLLRLGRCGSVDFGGGARTHAHLRVWHHHGLHHQQRGEEHQPHQSGRQRGHHLLLLRQRRSAHVEQRRDGGCGRL